MATLADVVAALDELYPPALAEPWDAVGLVCGDPDREVRRVLLAVDPTPEVAAEAEAYDLLLTHHPLYLQGTTSVAATDPKGRVVHRLIAGGTALFTAHTNADRARPGVNDALADLFGLRDAEPLEPTARHLDKLVVFVPVEDAAKLAAALADAGGGRLGNYDSCTWSTEGVGTFRALPGASPAIGSIGELERVPETRLEMVVPRDHRGEVLRALHDAHPYETPAYDVLALPDLPSDVGLGRVGDLPEPLTLRELTARAAGVLPSTAWGVRTSGDPDLVVTRLAVCGGAGDSTADAAVRHGAQALLTSDCKHHRTLDAPLALLDAAHWATEWPWLPTAADALTRVVPGLETTVSTLRTDPWTTASRSPDA